jgi:hypothetical protein
MKHKKAHAIAVRLNKLYGDKMSFDTRSAPSVFGADYDILAVVPFGQTQLEFVLDLSEDPTYNEVLAEIPHALAETALKFVRSNISATFEICDD